MLRVCILLILAVIQVLLVHVVVGQDTFHIAFLDVGQGDATYIRAENGKDLLVDGGASRQVLGELASQMSFFDRSIDIVVATHPDMDHIGGLPYVFDRYAVSYFIDPGLERDTGPYEKLSEKSKEAKYILGRTGTSISLSKHTHVEILFPDREIIGNINNSSVVLLVTHRDKKFLLMGDAGKEIERYIQHAVPDIDVLKVGHHGSKTSTGEDFIKAIQPEFAIISAGKDNRYGHPHEEVLQALSKVKTLTTYEQGSIVFTHNGGELRVTP